MKYVFGFIMFINFLFVRYEESIYDQPLKDIDGNPINLINYREKKIMFVILPLSAQDSSISAAELSSVEMQYGDSLIVIGVPGEETGYTDAIKAEVKALYSSQPSNFILTEGMKVKKTAGAAQARLFQWLTDKNKNKHFDQDVRGTGHKFFVDEHGVLYAVMGPQAKLSSPVIERILSRSTPQ